MTQLDEALGGYHETNRLRAIVDRLLVAGNHIATWRQPDWPDYRLDGMTREDQCEHALRVLGATRDYDMWCCWSAIMQARDDLEDYPRCRLTVRRSNGRTSPAP